MTTGDYMVWFPESRMYTSKCTLLLHYTFPILLNILNSFSGPGNSSKDEYLGGHFRALLKSFIRGTKNSQRKRT
jgi:hypothetical protein